MNTEVWGLNWKLWGMKPLRKHGFSGRLLRCAEFEIRHKKAGIERRFQTVHSIPASGGL
ncbi:hypothetical protein ACFQ4C_02335 [Larkinella insperata]|uniref:Uncharacterized protein n=1 Tax=Larkinella insperata TaxID=332158 RepID=A0ABW3Q5Z9_9BACT